MANGFSEILNVGSSIGATIIFLIVTVKILQQKIDKIEERITDFNQNFQQVHQRIDELNEQLNDLRKFITKEIVQLKEDFLSLKTYVAENYVRKDDCMNTFKLIENSIRKEINSIKEYLDLLLKTVKKNGNGK